MVSGCLIFGQLGDWSSQGDIAGQKLRSKGGKKTHEIKQKKPKQLSKEIVIMKCLCREEGRKEDKYR